MRILPMLQACHWEILSQKIGMDLRIGYLKILMGLPMRITCMEVIVILYLLCLILISLRVKCLKFLSLSMYLVYPQ